MIQVSIFKKKKSVARKTVNELIEEFKFRYRIDKVSESVELQVLYQHLIYLQARGEGRKIVDFDFPYTELLRRHLNYNPGRA